MLVEVFPDYEAISDRAAEIVTNQIRKKPDSAIGFATGSTPLGLYQRLIRNHKEHGLDFSKVTTFNLDEYVGLSPDHDQSYHYFMWTNLFSHVNVDPSCVHIPQGMADDIDAFCSWYEQKIEQVGGLDLQILGIGGNGHIAFNEPGSPVDSRTRLVSLSQETIASNSDGRFFSDPAEVPRCALSAGIGTIREASALILLATGKKKADAIAAAVEGPFSVDCPASLLQDHADCTFIIDVAAASKLTSK